MAAPPGQPGCCHGSGSRGTCSKAALPPATTPSCPSRTAPTRSAQAHNNQSQSSSSYLTCYRVMQVNRGTRTVPAVTLGRCKQLQQHVFLNQVQCSGIGSDNADATSTWDCKPYANLAGVPGSHCGVHASCNSCYHLVCHSHKTQLNMQSLICLSEMSC